MPVPRNWADPSGETIDIPLRRYQSADDDAPVLLIIQGGPGGSGTQLVTDLHHERAALRDDFTLVGFDPRGVWGPQGADHPLDCSDADEECVASDVLTRFASTSDVVLDIENLRRSLGDAPLRAVGYSYGTYIAAVYATLFPETAGRLVLDGAAPAIGFTPIGTERQMIAFEDALDRFIDACLDGRLDACPLEGDGSAAKAQLIDLRERLDKAPVVISFEGESIHLDGREFTDRMLSEFYSPRSRWFAIAAFLSQAFGAVATTGDAAADASGEPEEERPASTAHAPAEADDSWSEVGLGIAHAVMCAMPGAVDTLTRADLEPLHGEDYFFIRDTGDAISDTLSALVCTLALPVHLDPEVSYTGSEHFLVTSTSGDPATPFSDAATLADELHAVLLEVDAEGHTSVLGQSSCSTDAAMLYLIQGTLPADGATCTDEQ